MHTARNLQTVFAGQLLKEVRVPGFPTITDSRAVALLPSSPRIARNGCGRVVRDRKQRLEHRHVRRKLLALSRRKWIYTGVKLVR